MPETFKYLRTPNISVGLAHAGAWFKSWDVHTAHILSTIGNPEILKLATLILIFSAFGMILTGINVLIAAFPCEGNLGRQISENAFKALFVISSAILLAGFAFCIKTLLSL